MDGGQLSFSRPGHFIPWDKSLVPIACEGEWDLVIRLKSIRDSSEFHALAYLGHVGSVEDVEG